MLLFKKKFLDAIRNGTKTQTIRVWKRSFLKTGQRSYIPGAGYINIELVEPVEYLPDIRIEHRHHPVHRRDVLRERIPVRDV